MLLPQRLDRVLQDALDGKKAVTRSPRAMAVLHKAIRALAPISPSDKRAAFKSGCSASPVRLRRRRANPSQNEDMASSEDRTRKKRKEAKKY